MRRSILVVTKQEMESGEKEIILANGWSGVLLPKEKIIVAVKITYAHIALQHVQVCSYGDIK